MHRDILCAPDKDAASVHRGSVSRAHGESRNVNLGTALVKQELLEPRVEAVWKLCRLVWMTQTQRFLHSAGELMAHFGAACEERRRWRWSRREDEHVRVVGQGLLGNLHSCQLFACLHHERLTGESRSQSTRRRRDEQALPRAQPQASALACTFHFTPGAVGLL